MQNFIGFYEYSLSYKSMYTVDDISGQ